jgi:hypothetical protein
MKKGIWFLVFQPEGSYIEDPDVRMVEITGELANFLNNNLIMEEADDR